MKTSDQTRRYVRKESIVFRKTKEAFGGLSNMAGGYPLEVNGIRILSSEALYQACRYPHMPDIQKLIIGQHSPMTAKMRTKPYRKQSRPDWEQVRLKIMRWCLRVKLAQNWNTFGELLLQTDDRPIVEESNKDDFWGAKPLDNGTLVGTNALGRLLMELREEIKCNSKESMLCIEPLKISDFQLMAKPITTVAVDIDAITKSSDLMSEQNSMKLGIRETSVREEYQQALQFRQQRQQRAISEKQEGFINTLKPYPAYKESGLPWIGRVPAHWELRRAKTLFHNRVEKGFPDEPLLAATQSKGVVRKEDYEVRTVTAQKDLHLLKLVEVGDFVISLRSFQGGIEYAHCRGIISPAYTVLKPTAKAISGYFRLFFKSKQFIDSLTLFVTGIREGQNIDHERLSRAELPFPPEDEQTQIARFLDYANQIINQFIRAKRKQITWLNEQKQAIIDRAITGKMYDDVQFVNTKNSWFPQIPSGWDCVSLRRLIHRAVDGPHHSPNYVDEGIPFLSARNIKADRWSLSDAKYISQEDYDEYSRRVIPEIGDVLYTKGGTTGVARVVDLDFRFQVWVHVAVLKVKKKLIDSNYLALVLNSPRCYEQSQLFTRGATNQDLGLDRMKNIVLPVPHNIDVQRNIVEKLHPMMDEIHSVVARVEKEISYILEYRMCLVSDVVTGKLDVREAANTLPKVEEKLEIIDESIDELEDELIGLNAIEAVGE